MVADLGWLSAEVDMPLWAILTLAGYQRVTTMLTNARARRRDRDDSA
ncbi:hypothetical protein [Haloferax marisrubri]|nr:hypothetical protein [Haloferax marisrubri]